MKNPNKEENPDFKRKQPIPFSNFVENKTPKTTYSKNEIEEIACFESFKILNQITNIHLEDLFVIQPKIVKFNSFKEAFDFHFISKNNKLNNLTNLSEPEIKQFEKCKYALFIKEQLFNLLLRTLIVR